MGEIKKKVRYLFTFFFFLGGFRSTTLSRAFSFINAGLIINFLPEQGAYRRATSVRPLVDYFFTTDSFVGITRVDLITVVEISPRGRVHVFPRDLV